jgi:hypothetical protein
MRSITTPIVIIHALTHCVMHDRSPLPPWLAKERLYGRAQSLADEEDEIAESPSPWELITYFRNGTVFIYIHPTGLDDVLQHAFDALAVTGEEVAHGSPN